MNPTPEGYRPDIDGLRAVAVGAVLLFHAGVPGFSGGYVGVDVFFVISGFLITSILWRECEAGKFSILDFYERRVRRIMPALLATLVLALVGGLILMGVEDLKSLGKTVLATLGFISNVKFWRGSGYFEGASEMQPLLHTWSLAIEEQFYLFWPILLFLLHRYARRHLGVTVWLLTIGSLLLSAVGVFLSPSATFFLLPTRAWELSIGALIALEKFPSFSDRRRGIVEATAIGMIIIPIFTYTPSTLFPGLSALLPCLGTALLIQVGREGRGPFGRLLANRAFVGIGLISYSLYLVHFPILVYLRHYFSGELPLVAGVAGIFASLALAYCSYRWIELPFRNRASVSAKGVWTFAVVGNVFVGAAALAVWGMGGLPNRFTAERRALALAQLDYDEPSRRCIAMSNTAVLDVKDCSFDGLGQPDAFVWGDSHAAAYMPGLQENIPALGYIGRLLVFNSCPPLLDFEPRALSWADRAKCRERNSNFIDTMRQRQKPSLIIVAGYWSTYAKLLNSRQRAQLVSTIRRNLDALKGHRVVILLDTPRTSYSLPWLLAYGSKAPVIDASTDDTVSMALREAALGRAQVLDPSSAICPNTPCSPLADGRPILSDGNHLAASVARDRLTPYFRVHLPPAPSRRAGSEADGSDH